YRRRHRAAVASILAGSAAVPIQHRRRRSERETQFMRNMTTIEAKAYMPSRDFPLSKRFYQDLGFDLVWSSDDLAYFRHGNSSFLLQNLHKERHFDGFMMHLLVEDVDAWWSHVQAMGLAGKYGVKVEPA